MATKMSLEGYERLLDTLNKFPDDMQVNIYFTGSEGEYGVSWCPYCVSADPIVKMALDHFGQKESVFIYVIVDKDFWRDRQNPFRTDKDIFLTCLPTLIRWKNPQRLEGTQCEKPELLQMFFTD